MEWNVIPLIVFLSFVTRTFPAGSHLTVTDSWLFFYSLPLWPSYSRISLTGFMRLFFFLQHITRYPLYPLRANHTSRWLEWQIRRGASIHLYTLYFYFVDWLKILSMAPAFSREAKIFTHKLKMWRDVTNTPSRWLELLDVDVNTFCRWLSTFFFSM